MLLSTPRRAARARNVGVALTTALFACAAMAAASTSSGAVTKKTAKSAAPKNVAASTTTKAARTTSAPTKVAANTTAPTKGAANTVAPTTIAAAPAKPRTGTIRLGYFPNVTHAPAIAGVEGGFFQKALGKDVTLKTFSFNAGPAAIEALNSGAIDATYVGPNPAINAFVQSSGKAIRIVAGSTSGGAFLVVKPTIGSAADLKGKKVATPQLGGTQDVALRYWLKTKGLKTTLEGGGDVSVVPQDNAQTLETFRSGAIDGAWVPEPWATRLILEANARVLVDERDLWPKGNFTTTILIVNTQFLKDKPELVQGLIEGQVATIDFLNANPNKGPELVNVGIEKLTGRRLADRVINSSFVNLSFTNDPELSSMKVAADHAVDVDLLRKVDLKGIEDLTLLNKVLATAGKKKVAE